jgi:hypothetical protein
VVIRVTLLFWQFCILFTDVYKSLFLPLGQEALLFNKSVGWLSVHLLGFPVFVTSTETMNFYLKLKTSEAFFYVAMIHILLK